MAPTAQELRKIYGTRFEGQAGYRARVWQQLAAYFQQWVPAGGTVLDVGAGYCEYINNVSAKVKYAMDLNPDVRQRAASGVQVLEQDCTEPWPVEAGSLDAVFTSNFLEHLPDKTAVRMVLGHAFASLKPGGRVVAMGPNIKYVPGAYWDFFDHYVELTECSLAEALTNSGFEVERQIGRFLPYSMSQGRRPPLWTLRVYLAMPLVWPLFGKQFLVVARKPSE